MIKIKTIEELKGDYAVFKKVITFFNLPIYEVSNYTTSIDAMSSLKKIKQVKIKGFKNEN